MPSREDFGLDGVPVSRGHLREGANCPHCSRELPASVALVQPDPRARQGMAATLIITCRCGASIPLPLPDRPGERPKPVT